MTSLFKKGMALPIAFALLIAGYSFIHGDRASPTSDNPTERGDAAKIGSRADCTIQFMGGRPPSIPATSARNATALCYSGFAVLHSPISRTPLWAAEHLHPTRLAAARGMERSSRFHEEGMLPERDRADLSDYSRSGFDRGHLAPSADMPDQNAQRESFSLANIVPQSGELNRGAWADLEADVRSFARRRDAVYVVTGVTFDGREVDFVPSGRVAVPTTMWKAVVSPGEGASVWHATNQDEGVVRMESVSSFTRRTGIDPFPGMSENDRTNTLRSVR